MSEAEYWRQSNKATHLWNFCYLTDGERAAIRCAAFNRMLGVPNE